MAISIWEIETLDDGRFDLRRDRRPVLYDLDSLDEALSEARRRGAVEVVVIEQDGYRVRQRV